MLNGSAPEKDHRHNSFDDNLLLRAKSAAGPTEVYRRSLVVVPAVFKVRRQFSDFSEADKTPCLLSWSVN